jgi:AcrR family transcriptional regulator
MVITAGNRETHVSDAEPTRSTADLLVEHTVGLITEKGGSLGVNMREVARRAGFAHTNVYNYFPRFDDLLWEAFRRVLREYGDHLEQGLASGLPAREYLSRLIGNIVSFPLEHPGRYRFIGSDPIGPDFPEDILETVTVMKEWLFEAFRACAPGIEAPVADEACNIIYAYIDGETFNVINARVVPGEDVDGRVAANATRLFELLTDSRPGGDAVVHPQPPWHRDQP